MNFIDPRGTDITVNLYGGQDSGDPGHIGISINGGQSQGYYGNVGENTGSSGPTISLLMGNSVPGALLPEQRTPSKSITINTTPAQDQAVQSYLNSVQSSPGQYNLYTNNCATTAGNALRSGGISVPGGPMSFIPVQFFNGISY